LTDNAQQSRAATIVRLPDREAIAEAAFHFVLETAARAIETRGRFVLALAGGSTPRPLYERLSQETSADWARWTLLWGDERCVPPSHSDSNYRMVVEALLKPLKARGSWPGTVERMRGEMDPEQAALEYDTILRGLDAADVPTLDLILLGMGSDAHTASLFPYTAALAERQRLAVANRVPGLPAPRLTVTFPLINAARTVLFLVSGADKAKALALIHGAEKDLNRLPCQGVQPAVGQVVWLVDAEAAAHLPPTRYVSHL
jgi:6-phosphogluconolactonase